MPSSSDNSFIPKRKSTNRQRSQPGRKVFFVTIIAYSLIFASLLAAGGSVLYLNYTETQLEREVVLLDAAVNTFSVEDFKRVQDFNGELQLASNRVQNTVSTVALLDELDRVIAQPIQIENLIIERVGDQNLKLEIDFTTETLDAALFQRKVLNADSRLFTRVTISEINLNSLGAEDEVGDIELVPAVKFKAQFSVPVNLATFDPAEARRTDVGTSLQTFTVPPARTVNPTVIENVSDFDELEVSVQAPEPADISVDNETNL